MMKWKNMETYQKRMIILWGSFFMLVAVVFLWYVISVMNQEKEYSAQAWEKMQEESVQFDENALAYVGEATLVNSGTYVESLRDISIKNHSYRVVLLVWFRWAGDVDLNFIDNIRVYGGTINNSEVIRDHHEGFEHYQQMRLDVTCSRNFTTKRFPLDSHNLEFNIESGYSVEDVIFIADKANSGVNDSLHVSGYELGKYSIGTTAYQYQNTQNNPHLKDVKVNSEIVTHMQIHRSDWGLYLKCFVALLGTTIWIMLAVYVCANHKIDTLGTVSSALFGAVANVMIGASLLPDVLQLGLIEFVNFYGTLVVLGGTACIAKMNNIRRTYESKLPPEERETKKFAKTFGTVMLVILLVLCLVGNIIMPLSASARR